MDSLDSEQTGKEMTSTQDNVAWTSEKMDSLPEPTRDAKGDAGWIVQVVKNQNIEDFKTLEKKVNIAERKGMSSVSVPHIVAVYGTTEMIECMNNWTGIKWDEECEISYHIFGEAVEGLTVSKATALYLATFMDRTDIVSSLIKCAGEENIRCCFRQLHLSNPMEEVFMLDLSEKLKRRHSVLEPAIIPGHRVGNDGKRARVFIVYSKHVSNASSYTLDDLGLVMIRNPYVFAKEVESNTDMKIRVSPEDAKRAQKAISNHRKILWKNHSNLNIISVSPMLYRKNGADIIVKPCIVLCCSTKGVVPLGEPEFPKQLDIGEGDSIDVDVHEGYFKRSYNTLPSIVYHPTLKMGCNIGRSTPEYDVHGNILPFIGGTHGPFVKFNNKIGFLTCAHVLFDIPTTTKSVDFHHNVANTVEVVQPSVDATTFKGSACGHVHRAIFNSQLDPSIDVAVVELTDSSRIPTSGQFANASHNSHTDAGFKDLPEYNSGSIQTDLTHFCTTHTVVKFGSSSDVTRGTLGVCGVDVRPLSTVLGLPRCTERIQMTNQYQVSGTHPTMSFFTSGDSGSAVFMKKPGPNDMFCIGMAIGYSYVGTNPFPLAVVTPVGAILNAVGPEYSIASFP